VLIMHRLLPVIGRLVTGDDGQDLLEYGLLAVLIAVVAITGIEMLGNTIMSVFWEVIARDF
jgi:Flp pilus assembly pilin Flp